VTQDFHLLFEIFLDLCKLMREFSLEILALQRVEELARIDQRVEQHRQTTDPVQKPGARIDERYQLLACLRILAQQRKIGGATGDGFEQ